MKCVRSGPASLAVQNIFRPSFEHSSWNCTVVERLACVSGSVRTVCVVFLNPARVIVAAWQVPRKIRPRSGYKRASKGTLWGAEMPKMAERRRLRQGPEYATILNPVKATRRPVTAHLARSLFISDPSQALGGNHLPNLAAIADFARGWRPSLGALPPAVFSRVHSQISCHPHCAPIYKLSPLSGAHMHIVPCRARACASALTHCCMVTLNPTSLFAPPPRLAPRGNTALSPQ